MLKIIVEVPRHFLDAAHAEPEDFLLDAKLAMAAKLYELKRLSSGQAASLIGMDRLSFLAQLPRFGVPVIDLAPDDIAEDIRNA